MAHVVAFYPPVDFVTPRSYDYPPIPPGSTGIDLPLKLSSIFDEAYRGKGDPKDPRFSPALADPGSFAPMTIITCQCDVLQVEGQRLARRAKAAGVDSHHFRVDGVGHGWDKDVKEGTVPWKKREEAYAEAIWRLETVFGPRLE